MPSMQITVKLFAIYQETYSTPELQWQLPEDAVAEDILNRMIAEYPSLAKWREVTRFGINLMFVEPQTPLKNGDEVVLIPPVSGG